MNNTSYKEVANYYDDLWDTLEKKDLTGVNSRHREILIRLKKFGLKNNSKVLEIGCGIGILSNLISNTLKNGLLTGVDISPQSIEFASKKYESKKNLNFLVSDMTNFNLEMKYDIILFPDVLEHIPIEAHDNIFNTISKNAHDETIIVINLPNPRVIRWFKENDPKLLQIIDQDIETDYLTSILNKYNYYLKYKEQYCLYFNEFDYEWMVFSQNSKIQKVTKRSQFRVLMYGIIQRIKIWLN